MCIDKDNESPAIDWERLARAESHSLRLGILELLQLDGGRALSASELAFELRLPLGNVNYHVKVLLTNGSIVPIAERKVRGAIEHFVCLEGQSGDVVFRRPPFKHD